MAKIGRLWAGKLYGTNTGNLAAQFESRETEFTGTVRFMDDRYGPVVYEVRGTFDGSVFQLEGNSVQAPEDVETGVVTIKGRLSPDGQLRGEWSSTLGTGGTFILYPHDSAATPENAGALPEQNHTAVRKLGAIRLYAGDVQELIGFLRRDFNNGRVIVTYHERGNEITKYASDFENDISRLDKLQYLKLSIQEPEAYGINRLAVVELNARGSNEVRVQGIQETWVVGKAEAVTSQLRRYEKTLATTVRKFGLNINGILAVFTLVLLPDLEWDRRFLFVGFMAAIIYLIGHVHTKFIPNVIIVFSDRTPSVFDRASPQLFSWLIAMTAGLASAIGYGLLKGEFSAITTTVREFLK